MTETGQTVRAHPVSASAEESDRSPNGERSLWAYTKRSLLEIADTVAPPGTLPVHSESEACGSATSALAYEVPEPLNQMGGADIGSADDHALSEQERNTTLGLLLYNNDLPLQQTDGAALDSTGGPATYYGECNATLGLPFLGY